MVKYSNPRNNQIMMLLTFLITSSQLLNKTPS